MSSSNTPLASAPLRMLPDILARYRIPADYFSTSLTDAYASHYPRPVHPSRARIRRVELRKEKSGTRCEYLLVFVTLDGRPWTEAPLGAIKCDRTILTEDRDPMKPHPPPTGQFAYWLYLASSLYNFLKGGPPPYNGDELKVFSPNAVLTSRPIQHSWTLYTHEYTTLPAAGPVDVTEPQPEFPHWSRDVTVPPTLFHLAAAVSLLDKLQPEYVVPDRQCFWYTAMLYHLLVGQDALDAEVEHDAKRVAIVAAYCSEASRGTSIFASSATFRAHPGTFRDLFQRVTRKDIEAIRTEEALDAMACERRLTDLYGSLWDAMLDDRERFGSWGPRAVPAKEAVIDAVGVARRDMELEMVEAAARKMLEAERAKAAKEYEAAWAKAVEEREAVRAATAKEIEAERAAAIKEREAETAAAVQKLDAERAAMAKEFEAERAQLEALRVAAEERVEAAAAKARQLAALKEEHAAVLARIAEHEREVASGGAAPSKAQVQ